MFNIVLNYIIILYNVHHCNERQRLFSIVYSVLSVAGVRLFV